MIKFKQTLHTAGDGYWSDVAGAVDVQRISLPYLSDDERFGELRVYFDTASWDVTEHGLIYTDSQFIKELKSALKVAGLDPIDIDYSEQGMQGDNFVSLDVGPGFIKSFMDIAPEFAGK